MPVAIMGALLENLPKLQAQESLRWIAASTLGAGNVKKSDRDTALSELRAQAGIARTARVTDFAAAAGAMGFTVEKTSGR